MDNLFYKNHHERRGCSQFYTDQVISTFLMLKGVFSPTLRATQELFDSLFELLLCAPDYSCASKGARMLEVADRKSFKGRITDLVIHSIGLKVFGKVEQKARKHDPEKRRVWHKLCIWGWTQQLTISWLRKYRWRMSVTLRFCLNCSTHSGAS